MSSVNLSLEIVKPHAEGSSATRLCPSPKPSRQSLRFLDRLESAEATGDGGGTYPQEWYTYNEIGNLRSKGGVVYDYPQAGQVHPHAVTHLDTVQKYWYDANGNQTTRIVESNTYNLTYDAENRLAGVSGAAAATFVYGPGGERVKGTVNGVTTLYVGAHYFLSDGRAAGCELFGKYRFFCHYGPLVLTVSTEAAQMKSGWADAHQREY